MMNDGNTLVSVLVISYNSASFIKEALDSVARQTYQNIELIISDDSSTDQTVILCNEWLILNSSRFVRTELITAVKNSGVSSNCNRALKIAQGAWIKGLAGDDILLDDCIENYIKFIALTSNQFVFGLPSVLTLQTNIGFKDQMEKYYENAKPFFKLSPVDQFRYLLVNSIPVSPPTIFCSREALLDLEGFDERYACEDLPLYLKASYHGYKLDLLNKQTVIYRIHPQQLSYTLKNELINERWFYEQLRIKRPYFTSGYIVCNPLLSSEFLIQMLSKYLTLKMGNGTKSSGLLNFLSALKSRLAFSYIKDRQRF